MMELIAMMGYVVCRDGKERIAINLDHIISVVVLGSRVSRIDLTDSRDIRVDVSLDTVMRAIRAAKCMERGGHSILFTDEPEDAPK
jgi:hypothetical protein